MSNAQNASSTCQCQGCQCQGCQCQGCQCADNASSNTKNSFPLIGDKFPDLEVHSTHGRLSFPKILLGKWTVLFSHPGDFTPVCTTEFVSFAKFAPEFKKINTQLIGLSIDQVFSHIKWVEWIKENLDVEIPFPIISDNTGRVGRLLGMIHEKQGTDTVRAVFIIDDRAVIRLILYYPQEVGRNMSEILRAVKALQYATANKVAMPANWPENELIGNQVIIPPAKTEAEVKARAGQKDCYDWWFCHKKMTIKRK
ncbi:MAG TPA: peroxiredoxin [Candidatus Woesebacteria bacterium]|nr:peroxiredoxin [Candidatus Woesebacteria bacterium]